MLRIETNGNNEWVVIGLWHGAERVLCRSDNVFDCIAFKRDNA